MLTEVVFVQQRLVRASSIHGLAGMAAIMASTYKAYMGEGLGDFGKWLMKFKIPHFGKVRQSLLPAPCMRNMGDKYEQQSCYSRRLLLLLQAYCPQANTGIADELLALPLHQCNPATDSS